MGNRNLILSGVKGGGTSGAALACFAPTGTTLPTKAVGTGSALATAFLDAGWISSDGLKKAVNESTQTIDAFGSNSPVRKLVTSSEVSFDLTFLESGTTPIEIYNRLDLGDLVVDSTGAFDFTEGQSRTAQYAAVFDLVDGANRIRAICPTVEVTNRQEFDIKSAAAVQYGVTLTAYPGTDGVAVHWMYVVAALAH